MLSGSGAGLLLIATESGDRFAQLLGAGQIAAGEGNGKREFQLFKLMLAFAGAGGGAARMGRTMASLGAGVKLCGAVGGRMP